MNNAAPKVSVLSYTARYMRADKKLYNTVTITAYQIQMSRNELRIYIGVSRYYLLTLVLRRIKQNLAYHQK